MKRISQRTRVTTSGVLAAALVSGLYLVRSSAGGAVQGDPSQFIAQPSEWLPMTIEIRRTEPDGTVTRAVKYRTADGSTRFEQWSDGSKEAKNIQILSLKTNTFTYFRAGEWIQSPSRNQPNDGKPFMALARSNVTPVRSDDPRVQAAAHLGIPLTFFEWREEASTRVFCPELNMLEMFVRRVDSTETQVTRVSLGEPQVDFRPPEGAKVTIRGSEAGPGLMSR